MSDTPISDSTPHNVADLGMQIRRLERQLNAANKLIDEIEKSGVYEGRPINTYTGAKEDEPFHSIECCTSSTASKIDVDLIDTENHNQQNQEELKARIKRLEEAGDRLADPFNVGEDDIKRWTKAKEDKL